MKWYLRKLSRRMMFDGMEYAYGEFTFRIGGKSFSDSEITDDTFKKTLNKFAIYLESQGIEEILINRG